MKFGSWTFSGEYLQLKMQHTLTPVAIHIIHHPFTGSLRAGRGLASLLLWSCRVHKISYTTRSVIIGAITPPQFSH